MSGFNTVILWAAWVQRGSSAVCALTLPGPQIKLQCPGWPCILQGLSAWYANFFTAWRMASKEGKVEAVSPFKSWLRALDHHFLCILLLTAVDGHSDSGEGKQTSIREG